jgi:hypothetical protein
MKDKNEILKRPTVEFTDEEYAKIGHYCIDNRIKIKHFLKLAALYVVNNKVKLK